MKNMHPSSGQKSGGSGDVRCAASTDETKERSISEPLDAVTLDSNLVLQGKKSITIRHNGVDYRLQTTRQGKLILTK